MDVKCLTISLVAEEKGQLEGTGDKHQQGQGVLREKLGCPHKC